MQLDRILMPTDFSDCANAALTHAVALARQFGAELHLLHVTVLHQDDPNRPGQAFPGFDELQRRLEEAASSRLKRLVEEHANRGLTVFEAQSRGIAAAPAIHDYASDEGIDLIVLGTHGRRGLRRFLLGSVAEEVVRSAPCPVLTVRDEEEARRFQDLDLIVVPFDFSEDSARALAVAAELAATYGSRIDLVHVIVPSIDLQAEVTLWAPTFDFDRADMVRRAERRLQTEIDQLSGPEVPITPRILDGHVAASLTRHADGSKADLIVIGSHGLSGLEHALLGSVAEKVIRSASCPVLTLRQPDEEDDGDDAES
jgi:nucleotide-binding universal stress UspA family protein